MRPDVVVSRAGTITAVYGAPGRVIRTADEPPSPGDPQDPTNRAEETFLEGAGHLALDGSEVLTLGYRDARRGSALMVVDRRPGEAWSTHPATLGEGLIGPSHLAANASGAAVATWSEEITPGGAWRQYASFREAAGAAWGERERLPLPLSSLNYAIGIDDSGQVLLVFSRGAFRSQGVWAVQRTQDGVWEEAERIGPPGTGLVGMELSAGGRPS